MSNNREAVVTKLTRAYLKSLKPNVWSFKVFGNSFQLPGVPDFIGCCNGHFFGIELKREKGGKLSLVQQKVIAAIESAGGKVYVSKDNPVDVTMKEIEVFLNELAR